MKTDARPTLIAVDDDPEALRHLCSVMQAHYNVLATSTPSRAISWLENDPSVAVIIVDQVLKSGLGLDVLESAKAVRPDVRRVLITRYTDLSGIVQGLHSGAINKMVSKPLMQGELHSALAPLEVAMAAGHSRAAH